MAMSGSSELLKESVSNRCLCARACVLVVLLVAAEWSAWRDTFMS